MHGIDKRSLQYRALYCVIRIIVQQCIYRYLILRFFFLDCFLLCYDPDLHISLPGIQLCQVYTDFVAKLKNLDPDPDPVENLRQNSLSSVIECRSMTFWYVSGSADPLH